MDFRQPDIKIHDHEWPEQFSFHLPPDAHSIIFYWKQH